jgi:dihydropyrimidinase
MILLDVNAQSLADMKTLIDREGVTSFKLFMAYPGVLMVDDGQLFKAMRVAGGNGGMICVHAENGPVIQVLTEEAVAAGRTSPKYHMLTRPTLMEGEATHRAIRLSELAEVPLLAHSADLNYIVRCYGTGLQNRRTTEGHAQPRRRAL